MINPFLMKKYGALLFSGLLTVIFFFIGLTMWGFLYAMLFMFAGLVIGTLIGSLLLSNPFQKMLEGRGILACTLDSTGIIRFFVVGLDNPYVRGKLGRDEVNDVFNRDATFSLAPPKKIKQKAELTDDGGLTIRLSQEELNASRFGLYHYPMFMYNNQLKSMVTKDVMAKMESNIMANHNIIFLNRKVEDLSKDIKNFGRYIVEQHKKTRFEITPGWIIIIVIAVLAIIAIAFGKPLLAAFSTVWSSVG